MEDHRDTVADWIAKEILPHEASVRKWLLRRWRSAIIVDDVIQEAYCRIAGLATVDHIYNPAGYFQRTVHAVATDTVRRAKKNGVVPMTENQWLNVIDLEPLADRSMEAGQQLGRVSRALSELSETCRRAIELRRIDGLSQKEVARQLGVSESVVENHIVRGLKKLLSSIADEDVAESQPEKTDSTRRKVEAIGKPRSR
jgi:RNA polymerase sigma factor (sigma-70 family)